jgi:hypothetical protein
MPDPTFANAPYLTATCRAGQCVPIDVRAEGAADCDSSAECHLRAGVGCCETCVASESDLVAIADDSLLLDLACGPIDDENIPTCPACGISYPDGFDTECVDGRCALVRVMP